MEFEGVVYKILPLTQGTSARGEWQRQDVVFELPSEFSRKICVTFFNKPSDVAKLREGATYTVSVNVESREYNGRWYTDVRAWRLQPKETAQKRRDPADARRGPARRAIVQYSRSRSRRPALLIFHARRQKPSAL